MTGKTHIVAGVLVGAIYIDQTVGLISPAVEELNTVTSVMLTIGVASIVGATLPDIDIRNSFASKVLFPLRLIFWFLERICGEETFGHRKFTHTALFPLLFVILSRFNFTNSSADYYIRLALISIVYGILSHFILDMFNPAGIPLFAPLKKKNMRLMPKSSCIYTGSTKETVFVVLLSLVTAVYIVCSFAGVI